MPVRTQAPSSRSTASTEDLAHTSGPSASSTHQAGAAAIARMGQSVNGAAGFKKISPGYFYFSANEHLGDHGAFVPGSVTVTVPGAVHSAMGGVMSGFSDFMSGHLDAASRDLDQVGTSGPSITLHDDGNGNLVGKGVSGTIDYTNGALSVQVDDKSIGELDELRMRASYRVD